MSKFIDKLSLLNKTAPQPFGFGLTKTDPSKAKIQIIASLAQENANQLADCMSGADAGILCISKLTSGITSFKKLAKEVPDIPWGGRIESSQPDDMPKITKAGFDFLFLPAAHSTLALPEKEPGRILEVDISMSGDALAAINRLPVDAVYITSEPEEDHLLSFHKLMHFYRFAGILNKPLLVSVPTKVETTELQALWEAGIDGIVTEIKAGQPKDRLASLRQVIDKMEFPVPRKQRKMEAIIPGITIEADVPPAEEDDDEEE